MARTPWLRDLLGPRRVITSYSIHYTKLYEGLTDYVQAPAFSTAVGLLQYGKMHQGMGIRDASVKTSVGGLFKRLSTWLRGEF